MPGTKVQVRGLPAEVSHGCWSQVLGWRPCVGHSGAEAGGPPTGSGQSRAPTSRPDHRGGMERLRASHLGIQLD